MPCQEQTFIYDRQRAAVDHRAATRSREMCTSRQTAHEESCCYLKTGAEDKISLTSGVGGCDKFLCESLCWTKGESLKSDINVDVLTKVPKVEDMKVNSSLISAPPRRVIRNAPPCLTRCPSPRAIHSCSCAPHAAAATAAARSRVQSKVSTISPHAFSLRRSAAFCVALCRRTWVAWKREKPERAGRTSASTSNATARR